MRRTSLVALCVAVCSALAAQAATASTFTGNGTTATYTAESGFSNNVTATTVNPTRVRIDTLGPDPVTTPVGPPCMQIDPDSVECTIAPGGRVIVNSGNDEDLINAIPLAQHPVTINGGPDADFLQGGALDDRLNGEGGEDSFVGSNGPFSEPAYGSDRLDGGDGDDNFVSPTAGDEAIGGAGVDTVGFYAFRPGPGAVSIAFSLNDAADDGYTGSNANVRSDVENVVGSITSTLDFPNIYTPAGYYGPTLAIPEGAATLRGSAGPNTLIGGVGPDDIEGGGGNDSMSGGDGNDALRSADGFADVVKCGPGSDSAIADTLDVVSNSCESVTRSDAGNANDVPEDRPPGVQFASPNAGRLTAGLTTLTATATDDRGVGAVLFIDDDRIVCNDTAAPYTCDYRPTGDDVGRNTVSAMAVDTAQQTATTQRVFRVPRFKPARVSLKVTPGKDTTLPLRFRSAGRVILPAGVSSALGCRGAFVAIQVKSGTKTISTRRAKLRANCAFSKRVTFKVRRRFRGRSQLRFRAIFSGNSVLSSRRSKVRKPKIR